MKRVKNILLVLGTLIMVAAGALMPGIVSYLQSSYGAGMQESRSFDSFSLTLRQDSDTARLLRRLAAGNYWVEEGIDWANEPVQPVHTPKQAEDAAVEALELMVKCGVMDSGVLEERGTPDVTVSAAKTDSNLLEPTDGEDNAQISLGIVPETEAELISIAWNFWWRNGRSTYYAPEVQIDDATEKLLMATVPMPANGGVIDFDNQQKCWAAFLENHYGFDVINVEKTYHPDGDAEYIFDLEPEDGEGVLRIAVYFVDVFHKGGGFMSMRLVYEYEF